MKGIHTTFFVCAIVSLAGLACAQTQELPSAPSARIAPPPQQQTQPPAQAGPDPATQKPELQSLEDRKKVPQQPPAQQVTEPAAKTPAASPADHPAADNDPITKQAENNPDDFTFKKKVDEVNVIFTVTDKHGKFIKNLKKDDFTITDDNHPATPISFSAQTNLPLRVGLLIDASNSIRLRFQFEQQAAVRFLDQIVRTQDEAFVVGFDSTTEVTQDFTNNQEKLAAGVRVLRPGGGTALYDAVYRACKEKLMAHPDETPVRRAIILLSDGDDNQSRVTREEAIEMAQRAEVVIYAISTNLADKGKGDRELERMATATGGRAFFPFKIEEVSNAFSDIQEELRSQYAISYKPADFSADGRYRSIDIGTHNNKLRVRSRKGYFAPKS